MVWSRCKGLERPGAYILAQQRPDVFVQRYIGCEVFGEPTLEWNSDPTLAFMPAKRFEEPTLEAWRQIIDLEKLSIDIDEK